jgi:manganese/iron transport system substrate-binding protein
MLRTFTLKSLTNLTLLLGLWGCNSSVPQTSETPATPRRPLVVATTSVLCDLTRQVAEQTVDLKCLVGAGEDPHVYQPTPEDRKAIDSADLIFYAGYDFDTNLAKLATATSNPAPKVAVHEKAVPNPILGEPHDHEAGDHHEHEAQDSDHETTPDPHVWHDPKNGIRMVKVISNSLKELEKNQASFYQNNTQNISNELQQIDSWIQSQINTIPESQRKLVTTHDALGYYVNAYGLNFEGALEGLSTEAAPTAARVGELVAEIRQEGVPTIFAETTINSKLIEQVAKEANVKVSEQKLIADSLGEPGTGGETYQKMLIKNTQTIVEGLGGNYTAFLGKNHQ